MIIPLQIKTVDIVTSTISLFGNIYTSFILIKLVNLTSHKKI